MEENNGILLGVMSPSPVHICTPPGWLPHHSFPQSRKYLMDGLFPNQKTNKNIQIAYSLKHKHSKKCIYIFEK